MGSAYSPADWTGFFSAEVGASAGLAGLIFVAVSINLAQIVKETHLVSRSAKALLSLMGSVIRVVSVPDSEFEPVDSRV